MAQEIYHRSEWGNPNEQWGNVYLNADLTNELYKRASEYENSWVTDQLLNGVGTKPSIIMTPTAYEDGKLNSVKPAKTLGSELVTNETSGAINTSGVYTDIITNINATLGQKLQVTYTLTGIENSIQIWSWTNYTKTYSPLHSTDGTYTAIISITGNDSSLDLRFYSPLGRTGTISNISVKEIIDADFDFTRGSSATRVNEKGLIQDVQILSDELVQNGDFEEEGSELVTNGDYSSGSTDWVTSSGWTFNNINASFDGLAYSPIRQDVGLVTGKIYKITFTLNISSGNMFFQVGGGSTSYTTSDTYTIYEEATSHATLSAFISIFSTVSSVFTIDNVSVKEVGQNWTFGTGWSMGDGVALHTGSTGNLITNASLTINKLYKVQFEIVSIADGVCNIYDTGSATTYASFTTIGLKSVYITKDSSNALAIRSNSSNVTIDNISVIEVTDDTDLPRINYTNFNYQDVLGDELVTNGDFDTDSDWTLTGATINGGKVNVNSSSPVYIIQSNVATVGKLYKVELTVSNYVEGDLRLRYPFTISESEFTGNGTYVFYGTAEDARFELQGRFSGQTYNFSIDNVSVKELTEDVVVPYSGEGSLLLEPQSTNKVTYSEDFSQWSTSDLTLESGYLAPDGSTNAYKVTRTATNAYIVQSGGVSWNDARTIYARTVSGTGNVKLLSHNTNTNNTFTITEQWQRFEVNSTGQVTANFYAVDFRGAASTLTEVIIWGAQSEALSYATSYIPTEGTTKTRLRDICNNAGSSDLINSTEGVLYAEISALSNTADSSKYITISDGTYNNRASILFSNGSTNQIRTFLRVGGVSQIDVSDNVTDVTDFNKVAFSYKENDFKVYINGSLVSSDTSGSVWSADTITKLSFSEINTSAGLFNGNVKTVAVFKEALSDTELQKLTTI
jgi:hypothetical protein